MVRVIATGNGFDELPEDEEVVGSCAAGTVVTAAVGALQKMLHAPLLEGTRVTHFTVRFEVKKL